MRNTENKPVKLQPLLNYTKIKKNITAIINMLNEHAELRFKINCQRIKLQKNLRT